MPEQLMNLKLAQLHTPIFVGGKNLTDRLDPFILKGLEVKYFRSEKELHVTWNGETAMVPITNVKNMIPQDGKNVPMPEPTVVAPMKIQTNLSAQVDSPMGHVHAGPGAGKTGQEKVR